MGLNIKYIEWINEQVDKVYKDVTNLKMLELGNQIIRDNVVNFKTGKEYFSNLGYEHISIDLNGLDESLIKDISKEEDFYEFFGYFDVITNCGTLEHVEPFEAQYTGFLNIHNSLKVGGLSTHIAPDIEFSKKGHCQYYYDLNFWNTIVENSDYEFLGTTIINNWRHYAMKKIGTKFLNRELFLSKIYKVTGPEGGMYKNPKDKKEKIIKH